jgi:hypothetical protein
MLNIATLVMCVFPLGPALQGMPGAQQAAVPEERLVRCLTALESALANEAKLLGVLEKRAVTPCISPRGRQASPTTLQLAGTSPIPGSQIDSVEAGTALCRTTFGLGWRWLEFHEQGGWAVKATWEGVVPNLRGWVWIDDQRASCHLTGGSRGMTWAVTAQGAACQECNPYSGDTPCSEARPLVCVRQVDPTPATRSQVTN